MQECQECPPGRKTFVLSGVSRGFLLVFRNGTFPIRNDTEFHRFLNMRGNQKRTEKAWKPASLLRNLTVIDFPACRRGNTLNINGRPLVEREFTVPSRDVASRRPAAYFEMCASNLSDELTDVTGASASEPRRNLTGMFSGGRSRAACPCLS